MTDSPSFRDIASEAVEPVEAETQETPEVQPDAQVEQTEQTQEEVFAEKSDLAGKTPEQLEQTYNEWQKAYTAKRQKETQELKEYLEKIAELEKKLTMQPQASQSVEQEQLAREQVELGNMSVAEYTAFVAQQAREVAREEYKEMMAQEKEQQLASKALEQFEGADPRLNSNSPEYKETFKNEVQRELAELLDEHLTTNGSYQGFDAQTLTKQIIARRDDELDNIIKKRTIESTQAAKMREAKAKKAEVRGTTSNGQSIGGNSIRDILSEAVDSSA
jgi:vacuolar-type H+-ATPase subunit I/STV1